MTKKLSLAVADFLVGAFVLPLVLVIYVSRLHSHPFTYLDDIRMVFITEFILNPRFTEFYVG